MVRPLFSIIIPAYNEEKCIVQTIKSILAQDINDYEIIIIDDGSTDNTVKLVRPFIDGTHIKLINVNKGTAAGARNAGIMAARGKYVVFQDADCFADPTLLNNTIKAFKDFDVDGVATRTTNVKPKNWIQHAVAVQRAARWENAQKNYLLIDSTSGINVAIMKREVINKLNGFNESIFYYEDNDLTQRFFKQGYTAVFAPNVIQYHNDPVSLRESLGQCKNIAKGFHVRLIKGGHLTFSEYGSLLGGIISPLNIMIFIGLISIGYHKTKDLKGSFYLGVLWELRSLAKLWYFLTRWEIK